LCGTGLTLSDIVNNKTGKTVPVGVTGYTNDALVFTLGQIIIFKLKLILLKLSFNLFRFAFGV